MENKLCLQCSTPLTGRADKRFCDDQCRSNYNHRQRSSSEQMIMAVNKQLRLNRKILKILNPKGMSVVRKEVLREMGYNFNYFTSIYCTKEGNQYQFCYDVGILILEENKIRIIEYQPYMKT
jgi:predicted nucleic acid-binding Zn ribbon protein